ncbi:hypothetical protein C0989_005940 [Termitomyces sp. Mn162]|nr:hypothetical protein C0989_005940 [Termitomyces sp. Mn162]
MSEPPLDSQLTNTLRQTGSTSAIVQRPEPILSLSDVGDHSPSPRWVDDPPRRCPARVPVASERDSSPPAVSLGSPQTSTSGAAGRFRHLDRGDRNNTSFVGESAPSLPTRSVFQNLMLALGLGRGASRERRSLVGFILNLISGFSQVGILLARRRERAESVPINGENRGNAPSGRPTETARTPRALENASSIARDQLFWNIVLFCMGRHPLQIHSTIKPEVGKLSKSIVDTIPLVLYIPPPPGYIPQQQNVSVQVKPDTLGSKSAPAESEPKRRFWIMKCLTSVNTPKDQKIPKSKEDEFDENIGEPQAWEEYWEQGEYPFVILEENRAACAICLVDFVEPKRIWADNNSIVPKTESNPNPVTEAAVTVDVSKPILDAVSASGNNDHATTKLVDAGEGMQPLRLLACGHVFHVSVMQTICFSLQTNM